MHHICLIVYGTFIHVHVHFAVLFLKYEPRHEKTNDVTYEQVLQRQAWSVTEEDWKLEILDF